jgi:hypothetical protein
MHKAPNTTPTTTMNLNAGDIVLTGNALAGFGTWKIIAVQSWDYNKRMAEVAIQPTENGEIVKINYGKNTTWDVLTKLV